MTGSARSTVIVVTWRGRDHIDACLDALAAQTVPARILVVDNASDDGTAGLLVAHSLRPEVLRLPRNRGYAGGIAAALEQVGTQFVAWLNDDAAPAPGWLAALENAMDAEAAAGAAASVLRSRTGRVQSAGVRLTARGYGADATDTDGGVFGFCGGAALLRTGWLRAIGGVPASFFCYYEDTDTAWRLRLAGFRVVTVPGAIVTHRHGASSDPGSARFHRWNERNRLLTLFRCAPAIVALRELAHFTALTLVLPLRRQHRPPANFQATLRWRVLAEVAASLPGALLARCRIGRAARVSRRELWRDWAGRGTEFTGHLGGPVPR